MHAAAPIVHVSTASYRGTHIDGFHSAVRELVEQLVAQRPAAVSSVSPPKKHEAGRPGTRRRRRCATTPRKIAFPGMVSAADLRHLKEIFADFNLPFTLLPDYSESMDGATWSEYEKLQSGGTPIAAIRALGSAQGFH